MRRAPADLRACIVIDAALPGGQIANVAACLGAGLALAYDGFAGQALVDGAGRRSLASAAHPIAILRSDVDGLTALWQRIGTAPDAGHCSVFPRYAQRLHDAAAYWSEHAQARHDALPLLGLGLVGPAAWVRRFTGSLPLLR
jgi:hypothetical protein